MERFIARPVSVFDSGFTRNPFDYLKERHPQKECPGFQSEGKNFLFRRDDGNAVLKPHASRREAWPLT
jgi:hypothetical protein